MAYGIEAYCEGYAILYEAQPYNFGFTFAVKTPVAGTFTINVPNITSATEINLINNSVNDLSIYDYTHVGSGNPNKFFNIANIITFNGGIKFTITESISNNFNYVAGFYVMTGRGI